MIQFASTSNRGRFCILYSHAKWTVRVSTRSTSFALRASTVAFTSKKVIMNTSTHNLPSSSLRWKVLHFCCLEYTNSTRFLAMTTFFTFLPLRNHVILPLSHQPLSACKIGWYRKWGLFYWANHSITNLFPIIVFLFLRALKTYRWGCTRPFLQSSPWENSLGWVRSGFWWSLSWLQLHSEKLPKNKNMEPGIAVNVVVNIEG